MKSFTALLVIVTVTLLLGSFAVDGTDFPGMANCVRSQLGWGILTNSRVRCAIRKMLTQYLAMQYANCRNCDKYFHCQANFNAVYLCSGGDARRAAVAISECREISQTGTDSPDGAADMRANLYGRHGGDCHAKYGCAYNCNYKPSDGSCQSSNC
ncbi:hypothetical protein LSAT2_026478 [Lamellibrachia satsuma]|nr:hypothetical protein LSAT2_026478 [Lamellibrachia satsuma]